MLIFKKKKNWLNVPQNLLSSGVHLNLPNAIGGIQNSSHSESYIELYIK